MLRQNGLPVESIIYRYSSVSMLDSKIKFLICYIRTLLAWHVIYSKHGSYIGLGTASSAGRFYALSGELH